jgi:hypothetical protein
MNYTHMKILLTRQCGSVLAALTAPSSRNDSPQPAYRRPLLPGIENRNAHGALASTPTGAVCAVRTAGIIADPTSYLAPLECGFPSTNLQLMARLAVDGKWASQRVARRCGFRMDGIVRDGLQQRGFVAMPGPDLNRSSSAATSAVLVSNWWP